MLLLSEKCLQGLLIQVRSSPPLPSPAPNIQRSKRYERVALRSFPSFVELFRWMPSTRLFGQSRNVFFVRKRASYKNCCGEVKPRKKQATNSPFRFLASRARSTTKPPTTRATLSHFKINSVFLPETFWSF